MAPPGVERPILLWERLAPRVFRAGELATQGLSPNITQVSERKAFSAKDAKDVKESKASRTSTPGFLALFASFASFADKKAVRVVAASLMRE